MERGKVKWFNHAKGYGFIVQPGRTADLFVHVSNVDEDDAKTLMENDPVEFEVRPGRKGDEAYNVRRTG